MNKNFLIYSLLFITVAFASCIKKEVTDLKEEGSTFVKILGGDSPAALKKNPVDFVNVPQRILVCDLRRDANSNASLNGTTTVVVKDDTAAVKAKNPNYVHLPAAWYTLEAEVAKVGASGGTWTFTFDAGDFAKQIYITIPNATLLNPSSLYGLGFTITSVSADGKISYQKSVVVEIGAKNSWDGVYAVTGPMTDVAVPTLTQFNDPTWDVFEANNGGAWQLRLVTTGAAECEAYDWTYTGWVAHPILSAGAVSGYGGFGLVVRFDPTTNTVASVHNWYGDPTRGPSNSFGNPATGSGAPNYAASNTRRAVLDPTGQNAVQGNKDILIKYLMIQPSVVPSGPRTTFDETWKYIGPR
jgi:Domain of unknown function (DUF1735)